MNADKRFIANQILRLFADCGYEEVSLKDGLRLEVRATNEKGGGIITSVEYFAPLYKKEK